MARRPPPSRRPSERAPRRNGSRPGSGRPSGSKAVRQAQRATSGGRNWGLIAGLVALVLFVGGVLTFAVLNAGSESPQADQDRAVEGLDVEEFDLPADANSHVQTPVQYPQTPPVGGPHNPVWQTCGVYDAPVAAENAVHSLEHGAVWITYDPALPQQQVAALQDLAAGQDYVLVTPFQGLPDRAVYASAWGVQLQASGAQDPRLEQFVTAYSQGPQTPELGATCAGGTGAPTT